MAAGGRCGPVMLRWASSMTKQQQQGYRQYASYRLCACSARPPRKPQGPRALFQAARILPRMLVCTQPCNGLWGPVFPAAYVKRWSSKRPSQQLTLG